MIIYDFWVNNFPFLSTYGDLIPIALSVLTIIAMIRVIIFLPIYLIGGRKHV